MMFRETRCLFLFLVVACSLTIASPALAEDLHAFVGAEILPIEGAPIANGVLIVRGSAIEAVGSADSVEVPPDAEVHDVSGKVLMPGLVDTHSHIGGGWAADRSGPIQPGVSVYDGIFTIYSQQ